MNIFKKSAIAAGLAATALVSTAAPVMAQDFDRGRDNTAAVAIGAGILGLAIGAIAASDRHDDRYYYDGGYAPGWSYRDGYYWNGDGHRYDRNAYHRMSRGHRGDMRDGMNRGPGNYPSRR